MTTEERLARMERNLDQLVVVQDQMMDLLGMTMEGERRLATRTERMEQCQAELQDTVREMGRRHNAWSKLSTRSATN